MGYVTQLEAINEMLVAAGEQPVSNLVTPEADIGVAQVILDSCTRNLQVQGLAGNTFRKTYTVGVDGTIAIGDDILAVSIAVQPYGDHPIQVVIVGGATAKLYNTADDTDDFSDIPSGELEITEIRYLAWDDISTPIQIEIVGYAKQKYQMLVQGDSDMNKQLIMEMLESQKIGRVWDSRVKSRSLLDPNFNPIANLLIRSPGPVNGYPFNRFWRG